MARCRIFGARLDGGPRDALNRAAAPDQVEALPSLSSPLPPAPSEAAELHASVEQGDAEAVARHLQRLREANREGWTQRDETSGGRGGVERDPRERDSGKGVGKEKGTNLVDCPCPRTGMTPLLKAVETGSGGVVRLLLEAGADTRSKVGRGAFETQPRRSWHTFV